MKKIISTIMIWILVLTMTTGLTGCHNSKSKKKETAKKPAVCYIIANTANSQKPNFNSPLVQDTLLDCAQNYGFVAVINADGDSEVLLSESLDIDKKYKSASPERLEKDARNKASNILHFMETVIADDPEVDYLEALRLSCRLLSSLEGYTSKTIIVLGTGLQTSGNYLNFNHNLISADPKALTDLLEEKQVIPDFSDTIVYWQGMADTADPQEPLSPSQCTNLQNIWASLIERGNGEFEKNDFISNPSDTSIDYPPVSVIDLPEDTLSPFDLKDTQTNNTNLETPIIIPEKEVCFTADTAEYLYPEKAMKTLKAIAEFLAENKQINVLLAGCTAGDESDEKAFTLSAQRAITVKKSLISLGIETERITTIGLASTDPWHVSGAGYNGSIAEGNRKVVLINATSPLSLELQKNTANHFTKE